MIRFGLHKSYKISLVIITSLLLVGCSGKTMESVAATVYEAIDGDDNKASSMPALDINFADKKSADTNQTGNTVADTDNDNIVDRASDGENSIEVYGTDGDLLETEISVIDEDEQAYNDGEQIIAADLMEARDESLYQDSYAYSRLDSDLKRDYREIYAVITNMLTDVILTSKDTKDIDLAFKCMMVDHPEIFYVKGYSLGKYMYGTTIDRISLTGTYTYTKGEVEIKKQEIEAYITNVIYGAPVGDDYAKIKYVYDYLIRNNVYEEDSPDNQNILSVVENGRTVCQGYAKMTQLLLNRMGLFCTLVNGTASGSNGVGGGNASEWGSHVWNIVKCNGRYYNMDTTWGDAAFTLVDEETGNAPTIEINYEFLLVNDATLKGTHRPKPVVTMPVCDSLNDNYYVHDGRYFTEIDEEQLERVFDNAYATADTLVFLKAADLSVYGELKEYLIDKQNIFKYVSGDNIKYVEYPERRLILISL